MPSKSVFFIDSRVSNFQSLVEELPADAEVFVLNADSDGLVQMVERLQGRSGIDTLHIISHGSEGTLYLGSTVLNNSNLQDNAGLLASLGGLMAESGDILLYGCNVAQADGGLHFINTLAQLTQADVAASDNLTGATLLSADWLLERSNGAIESTVFSSENFLAVLAYSTPLDIRFEQGIENGKFVVKLFSEMLGTESSNIALNFTYASSGLSFSDVSFGGSSAVSSSLSSSNGNGTVSISGQFVPNGIAALPFAKLFFAGSGTGSFNIDFSRLALNAVSQTYIDPPATTYDLRVVAGSDTIPPTVTTFSPSNEANGVAIASNIVVTFNEAITKGTGNILLKTIGGSTLTSNPTADVSPADIGYILEILSKNITESELHQTLDRPIVLIGGTIGGGSTSASTSTTISASSGGATSASTSTTISASSGGATSASTSTAISASTSATTGGTTIASYDAATSQNITVSGSTLTLNPTADLTPGTRYVVEFQAGSVKDLAGNNYAGTTSYNFTTAAPVGRVLSGTNGNDTLFGTIGQSEIINALGGDDRITIGGDEVSDSVSGGDGFDTVVFTNDKADYLISRSPSSGSYDVISKRGVVNLIGRDVEKLEFRDGTVDPSTSKYYGTATAELPGSVSSVYRFFNVNDNAFFYTNNVAEKNAVLANSDVSRNNVNEWSYVYQGSSFEAAHTYAGAVPLERFYNTLTKHHFFTSSQSEAAIVKANSASGAWPFVYEGGSFNVYANDPTPNSVGQEIPVERFYSAVLNRHWFTADPTEIAQIRLTGLWVDEGVGYWAEKPGP